MSNLSDRGTLRGTLQRNSGNYNDLINKPAINGHTLIGNQSGHALGLANEDDIIYVEANPLGPATADLHKILVDDTIYSIPDVVVYGTASGAIASFDDGGNDKPLKSLKVAVNPVQSGSGDPSPSNVRPISGWDECKVMRTGKNLFNKATVTSKKGLNASGTLINVNWCSVSDYIAVKPNIAYHMAHGVGNSSLCGGAYYTADKTFIAYINTPGLKDADFSFTTPNNVEYIRLNVTTANLNTAQIELGTTATEYEPYASTTYTIDLDGTRYGGTLDVVSGVLKVTDGYIASYNGETLPSTWISDRDIYTPNTSPTTGAEVVYKLATPQEIQLTPTEVTTLLGNNNIWSDTGEIEECVYQRDLNIAINKALSQ